ncbi:hypothetical protein EVAR_66129_1 [Eumeta japonica]|uniref:Uncharacterized protein n=1 Tax=Eumeta variegata TaxID=151549 RepID=A0A4C1YWU6_EUMVA|nr:hypothetical protein EVAR_66129_1 [Eumeta japonica]
MIVATYDVRAKHNSSEKNYGTRHVIALPQHSSRAALMPECDCSPQRPPPTRLLKQNAGISKTRRARPAASKRGASREYNRNKWKQLKPARSASRTRTRVPFKPARFTKFVLPFRDSSWEVVFRF